MTRHPGWVRLWAVAILAHIIGNPRWNQVIPDPTLLGGATAVLAILGTALLLAPSKPRLLVAANVGVVVVAGLEMPVIGNHWLLAALVAIGMLVASLRPQTWEWFTPVARWMLLGFYAWAAFAKLNSAFLDPAVSCGLVYANQWLAAAGLPTIAPTSPLAWGPVVGAALIELAVPVLLVVRRTRPIGVLVGVAFHGLISFDLGQHFYDFTALLIALFVLFLPSVALDELDRRFAGPLVRPFALAAGLLALLSTTPAFWGTVTAVTQGVFVLWVPFMLWFGWFLVTWTRQQTSGGLATVVERDMLRVRGVAAWVLVGVVILNGLAPYLEVKTATSWNMYANLVTAGGETNHLIVRRTLPLTDHQERVAVILDTDDPRLAHYVDSGWALPERNLTSYLATRPHSHVRYEIDGEVREATGLEIGESLGLLTSKLGVFRAVDTGEPARCQLGWLPAY